MLDALALVARFTAALTGAYDASTLSRDIVHGHVFEETTIGARLLATDIYGELKTIAFYGREISTPETLSLWDDEPIAIATNSGEWSQFEVTGQFVAVIPFTLPLAPLGCLLLLSKKKLQAPADEVQLLVSRLGGYYLKTTGLSSKPDGAKTPSGTEELTDRQREILGYVSLGQTNAEIARVMLLSESTIRQETVKIYRALGVSSRTEAWKKAQALGLIRPITPAPLEPVVEAS